MTANTLTPAAATLKAIEHDLRQAQQSICKRAAHLGTLNSLETIDLLAFVSAAEVSLARLECRVAELGISKALDPELEAVAARALKPMFLHEPDETGHAFKVAQRAWAIWNLIVARGHALGHCPAAGEAMTDCLFIVDNMIAVIEDAARGAIQAAA